MGKINWGRVLLGGLLAGVVINISEGVLNMMVLRADMIGAMAALGKNQASIDAGIPLWVLWAFIIGLAGVWLYAAIRPRFGAGPKTAAIAGIAIWVISCLAFGIGMKAMNLMPDKIAYVSVAWGLVEDLVAFQLGAWVYKEA